MTASQADLFGSDPGRPRGLRHADDLIDDAEAGRLVARFGTLPFQAFDFHGFKGRRRIVSFGARYDFSAARLEPAEPLPDFLVGLARAAADFAGVEAAAIRHAMVTEYAPGAPIGWHRDRPEFDKVIGVSFVSPCVLRSRRRSGAGWDRYGLGLKPRSVYLLDGEARTAWEHSITPATALRYSVTFRTLRAPAAPVRRPAGPQAA